MSQQPHQQQQHQPQQQQDPTFFPETVIEGQIDSEFVIYGFANSFSVPQWVPEKKQKNCMHCKDTLKSNATHNCRLCGNIFCSHCTGKYHLPEKYELKSKQGPTRVCYGCKMSCTRMRQAALNLPLDSIQRMLTPPQWQELKAYIACNKCCVKKRRDPHNCRLCGNLFCDDCTVKMPLNLPPAFNIKKKLGPQRICDGCRYRVIAGARLDDGTQQHIQSFLLRQQQSSTQNNNNQNNNGINIEPLVLTNDTGPIGQSIQSPRHTANGNNNIDGTPTTAAQQIRILYTNQNSAQFGPNSGNISGIPSIAITPLELTQHNGNSPDLQYHNHTHQLTHEMNQITSTLNTLSLDSGSDGGGLTPRDTGLTHVRFHYPPVGGPQHQQQGQGGQGVPTPPTRTQRYQAAMNNNNNNNNNNNAYNNNMNNNGSISSISSPSPSTSRPLEQPLPPPLQPTGQQLQNVIGGSSTPTTPGQPKKRPIGGRDIYRALSTVQPASYLPMNQSTRPTTTVISKGQQNQTLDDQKEGDMDQLLDDDVPPPPPPPPTTTMGVIDHQRLVKPSDLFNKLKDQQGQSQQQQTRPAYLKEDHCIEPGQ